MFLRKYPCKKFLTVNLMCNFDMVRIFVHCYEISYGYFSKFHKNYGFYTPSKMSSYLIDPKEKKTQ